MSDFKDENKIIADTIHGRVQTGQDTIVTGWQQVLTDILTQLKPFMAPGHLVTFQSLQATEKKFYEDLLHSVHVPGHVLAIYMPPSVRHQMMYANHGPDNQVLNDHDPDNPPDAGVVLATAVQGFSVILNALFAYPSTLAATDVYDRGQLVAGYTYSSIEDCQKGLKELMQTYFTEFQQQENVSDG